MNDSSSAVAMRDELTKISCNGVGCDNPDLKFVYCARCAINLIEDTSRSGSPSGWTFTLKYILEVASSCQQCGDTLTRLAVGEVLWDSDREIQLR